MNATFKTLAATALALSIAVPALAESSPPTALTPSLGSDGTLRLLDNGVELSVAIESLAEGRARGSFEEQDPVSIRLALKNAGTATPMTGLGPYAWIDHVSPGRESAGETCKQKVQKFLSGSLLSAPEVDLNAFYVLALNADPTVTVIDPLLGFGGSKLLALLELESPGEDWILSLDGEQLFVSMPDSGSLAVAETARWRSRGTIATGGRPARLWLQPDGRYLWVADEAASATSGVIIVDPASRKVVKRVPTGPGPHDLVVTRDNRYAFVSNGGSSSVSVIEVSTLTKVADLALAAAPTSLAYSELAGAVYAASRDAGTVSVLDVAARKLVSTVAAEPGLGWVSVAPGGRYLFIPNPERNTVSILDTASNRIVQSGAVQSGPDQVTFSAELAYIRRRDSETVQMIPLDALGKEGASLPLASFPSGQAPVGRMTRPASAPSIVRTPEPTSVLVANPGDRTIYYYKEGAAAPMGSFQNYKHEPRALLVVDRTLKETSPGTYATTVRVERPGRYDLAVFLDSPSVAQCVSFEVSANAELAAERKRSRGPRVEYLDRMEEVPVGEAVKVRFRLLDPESDAVLPIRYDVQALAFLVPGRWQTRLRAVGVGEGVYQVEMVPGEEGFYVVQVESPSLGLSVQKSAGLSFHAVPRGAEGSRP